VPELSEHWLTTLSQLAGDEQRPCRFIALALESLLPSSWAPVCVCVVQGQLAEPSPFP
jgi:hypothetical protein